MGAPRLVPAALAVGAVLAAWALRDRIFVAGRWLSPQSPETQVARALQAQTRAHLDDVYGFRAGGTLELSAVRFRDVLASFEGRRATVVAMLQAEGRVSWRLQSADLAYVGRERFHMQPCSISQWCAEGDQFERLRQVLRVLFRRLDAFHARDAAAYAGLVADSYGHGGLDRRALLARLQVDLARGPGASVRVLAWQIRVERETAEVGEDYQVHLAGREPERRRARFGLVQEGGRWLFASGL